MRTIPPVSPGEMLEEEFLKPLGLTKYRLAKDIGVPPQRIGDIVAGKRSVTADTDLRLCRYFGLSDGWWLRGQASYDTALARESMQEELALIPRCSLLAASTPLLSLFTAPALLTPGASLLGRSNVLRSSTSWPQPKRLLAG